uniref:Uncharacterized protein n=1 Tax=Anguilla anguilla TaxID=7936 RepID=A0A0E9SWI9_ANGAN
MVFASMESRVCVSLEDVCLRGRHWSIAGKFPAPLPSMESGSSCGFYLPDVNGHSKIV